MNFLDFCFSLSYLQSPGLWNDKKEEEDKNKSEFTCIYQPVGKRLQRTEQQYNNPAQEQQHFMNKIRILPSPDQSLKLLKETQKRQKLSVLTNITGSSFQRHQARLKQSPSLLVSENRLTVSACRYQLSQEFVKETEVSRTCNYPTMISNEREKSSRFYVDHEA